MTFDGKLTFGNHLRMVAGFEIVRLFDNVFSAIVHMSGVLLESKLRLLDRAFLFFYVRFSFWVLFSM